MDAGAGNRLQPGPGPNTPGLGWANEVSDTALEIAAAANTRKAALPDMPEGLSDTKDMRVIFLMVNLDIAKRGLITGISSPNQEFAEVYSVVTPRTVNFLFCAKCSRHVTQGVVRANFQT